jgi:hypothetical protein
VRFEAGFSPVLGFFRSLWCPVTKPIRECFSARFEVMPFQKAVPGGNFPRPVWSRKGEQVANIFASTLDF